MQTKRKSKRKKTKGDVKHELVRSLKEGNAAENEESNKSADNLTNYEEAIPVVQEYETIVRFEKNDILDVAYRQGIMFKKFKDSNRFVEMLKKIEFSKSIIYFKLKIVNILDRYPKLKKSSMSLNLFKDYLKTIKEICKEIDSEFSFLI